MYLKSGEEEKVSRIVEVESDTASCPNSDMFVVKVHKTSDLGGHKN